MLSGDGLIVRVRLSCGEVSAALAAEIADCAQSYGNGVIDLSGRGNLQIRGVSEATWAPLIERLSAGGLIDASTEAEAVRNVLVSPFAGFFPDTLDVRPIARAFEAALGASPSIYHLDVTNPNAPRARSLQQEIARALRGRVANPRWLRGQMRHGYRGAAEIAESVDNLFLFAATTDLVSDGLFDLMFEAVCADREVRDFLRASNPEAALAIAKRFDEALRRGFWRSRRNSVEELLSHMREAA